MMGIEQRSRHDAKQRGEADRQATFRGSAAESRPVEFGHSGVPIPIDLPEGETKIARQFTAGDELELIESRRDG